MSHHHRSSIWLGDDTFPGPKAAFHALCQDGWSHGSLKFGYRRIAEQKTKGALGILLVADGNTAKQGGHHQVEVISSGLCMLDIGLVKVLSLNTSRRSTQQP